MTQRDIGRKIIMFREPTEKEWQIVGKCTCLEIGKEYKLKEINENSHGEFIRTNDSSYAYPMCCFKFVEENYTIY